MTSTRKSDAPAMRQDGCAERGNARPGAAFKAPVDILETDGEVVVVVDLPGARSEAIDIRYEEGILTVSAPVEQRRSAESMVVREYGVGDFRRTFRVGQDIDVQGIAAEHRDGVLRLRLPRSEASRPRKIKVNAG